MKRIVIYHPFIPKLGGIETVVKNLSKELTLLGYDVTVAYQSVKEIRTLYEYAEYARVVKLDRYTTLACDVLILSSNWEAPKNIKAAKTVQWIHADYEKYKLKLVNNPTVSTYVAVSQHVANVAKRLFNIDCQVIYNVIDCDFGKGLSKKKVNDGVLKLVTNSRISPEKGFMRMLQMALDLNAKGIKFTWDVYGTNSADPTYADRIAARFNQLPQVSFKGMSYDVARGLVGKDYMVLLSDFEGCPLAVLEALQMGVAVITTNYPSAYELVNDGENGYIIDMDMSLLGDRINTIVKHIPSGFNFNSKGNIKLWQKIIEQ